MRGGEGGMFARAAGRLSRCGTGLAVLQGTCHPPLAAHTARTPRHWQEADGTGQAEESPASHRAGLPLFLFCHANGFHKEVWRPVVEELVKVARAPFRWIALDFSGHGDTLSRRTVKMGEKWEDFAVDDIVTVLQELQGDASFVVGVGHSLGGASLLLTELQHKGAFDRLALFEPIVLPHPDDLPRLMGVSEEKWVGAMQRGASKRRTFFTDTSAVAEYMRGRQAFKRFDPRTMDEYIAHGTCLNHDGTERTLKCPPAVEAAVYGGRPHHLWSQLHQISCPTLVACGGLPGGGMLNSKLFKTIVERLPAASLAVAPAASHFLVMEAPKWCALQIASSCQRDLPLLFSGVSAAGDPAASSEPAKL